MTLSLNKQGINEILGQIERNTVSPWILREVKIANKMYFIKIINDEAKYAREKEFFLADKNNNDLVKLRNKITEIYKDLPLVSLFPNGKQDLPSVALFPNGKPDHSVKFVFPVVEPLQSNDDNKFFILQHFRKGPTNNIYQYLISFFDFLIKNIIMLQSASLALSDFSTTKFKEDLFYISLPENVTGFLIFNTDVLKKISESKDYYLAFKGLRNFCSYIISQPVIIIHPNCLSIIKYYILVFDLLENSEFDTKMSIDELVRIQTILIYDMILNIIKSDNLLTPVYNSQPQPQPQPQPLPWQIENLKILYSVMQGLKKENDLDKQNNQTEKTYSLPSLLKEWYTPEYKIIYDLEGEKLWTEVLFKKTKTKTLEINERLWDSIKDVAFDFNSSFDYLFYKYQPKKMKIKTTKNNTETEIRFQDQVKNYMTYLQKINEFSFQNLIRFFVFVQQNITYVIFKAVERKDFELLKTVSPDTQFNIYNFKDSNIFAQITEINTALQIAQSVNFLSDFLANKKLNQMKNDENIQLQLIDVSLSLSEDRKLKLYVFEESKYKSTVNGENKFTDLPYVLEKKLTFDFPQTIECTKRLIHYCSNYLDKHKKDSMYVTENMVFFVGTTVYFSNEILQGLYEFDVERKTDNLVLGDIKKNDAGGALRFFYILKSNNKKKKYTPENFQNKKSCFINIHLDNLFKALSQLKYNNKKITIY
jgi:hypothetical protein